MWSSSLPVSLFSCISLFIAVLSHFLGLLGTVCQRSARFARFARLRAARVHCEIDLERAQNPPNNHPKTDRFGIKLARRALFCGLWLGGRLWCMVRVSGASLNPPNPPKIESLTLRMGFILGVGAAPGRLLSGSYAPPGSRTDLGTI